MYCLCLLTAIGLVHCKSPLRFNGLQFTVILVSFFGLLSKNKIYLWSTERGSLTSGAPNGSFWYGNICSEKHYPPKKFGLNSKEKQAFSLPKGHSLKSRNKDLKPKRPCCFRGTNVSLKVKKKGQLEFSSSQQ